MNSGIRKLIVRRRQRYRYAHDVFELRHDKSNRNCGYYEHLMPLDQQNFGLTAYPVPDEQGMMRVPDSPGLGFELDWDWIGHHKVASLS